MNSSPFGRAQAHSSNRPGVAQPKQASMAGKRPIGVGTGGKGKGAKGLGQGGKGIGIKRHRKIILEAVRGVTKGDIRRMARRGGVKRISGLIYEDVRNVLKGKLTEYMKDICAVVEHSKRATVTVSDVIFVLRRQGRPIWGFDDKVTSKRTVI